MTLSDLEDRYPRAVVARKWIHTVHSRGGWFDELFGDGWTVDRRTFVELRLASGDRETVEVPESVYEDLVPGAVLAGE